MSTLKYYFLPKISQIRKQGNLRFPPNSFVSGEKFFNHFRRGVYVAKILRPTRRGTHTNDRRHWWWVSLLPLETITPAWTY